MKINAECANAIKSLQVDVEAALKVMQKSMVENTYTELKARIKKEVDKAQHPALQSICVEFEERLKQVGRLHAPDSRVSNCWILFDES